MVEEVKQLLPTFTLELVLMIKSATEAEDEVEVSSFPTGVYGRCFRCLSAGGSLFEGPVCASLLGAHDSGYCGSLLQLARLMISPSAPAAKL